MSAIELKGVRKSFQSLEVVHGIDLRVEDGAFTVFVGPSGCGKSTLLRMIAGLEELSGGEILIDGVRCDHLLPAARGMAMVFQSYALYPHMSVEQNLRFGLENFRVPRSVIDERVKAAADILQISHLMKRRPNQLSGGQSQRVAIGRAIVKEPKAFLFDEPLSNLDAELRVKMRGELVSLHERLKATMIFVTHDQVEAMTMADKIVVLREGIVEQAGEPVELYARPRNQFVAAFLGAPQMNMLKGAAQVRAGGAGIALEDGTAIVLAPERLPLDDGAPVTLGIRPEHVVVGGNDLTVKVESTEVLGSETIVHARLSSGQNFTFSRRGISGVKPGDHVPLGLPAAFLHVFDRAGLAVGAPAEWRSAYVG
jgi:multiple sugar transport system ATP-binding protein